MSTNKIQSWTTWTLTKVRPRASSAVNPRIIHVCFDSSFGKNILQENRRRSNDKICFFLECFAKNSYRQEYWFICCFTGNNSKFLYKISQKFCLLLSCYHNGFMEIECHSKFS